MNVSPVLDAPSFPKVGDETSTSIPGTSETDQAETPTFGTDFTVLPRSISRAIEEGLLLADSEASDAGIVTTSPRVIAWQRSASQDIVSELWFRSPMLLKLVASPFLNCWVASWLESAAEVHSSRYWLLTEDELVVMQKPPAMNDALLCGVFPLSCCCLVPSKRATSFETVHPTSRTFHRHNEEAAEGKTETSGEGGEGAADASIKHSAKSCPSADDGWTWRVRIWKPCSSTLRRDAHQRSAVFLLSNIETVEVTEQRPFTCGSTNCASMTALKISTGTDPSAAVDMSDVSAGSCCCFQGTNDSASLATLVAPDLRFGMKQRIIDRREQSKVIHQRIDTAVSRALTQVTYHEW